MGSNVSPIGPGIVPEIDVEREMIQFVAEKLRDYRETYGMVPEGIAVVFVGQDHSDGVSVAQSWSPGNEERSRLHCCAVGSALLMKRALGV